MFSGIFGNSGYSAPTPTPIQVQTQLSLQKLDTKQSVVNSIGMFLAIAEGYLIANGIKIHPLFAYYDHFGVTKERPELIRIKLMNNYMTYSAQKQNYINTFHMYDFYPDNLSADQIRNIIQEWIPYATQIGEESLYLNILKLFDDGVPQSNYSYYNDIQGYKDTNPQPNTTIDPRNHAKAIANIQSHKEEENRKNRERWNNTGKHEINIILNGKSGSSSLSEKMKPITQKTQKQTEEEIADINMMRDITLQLVQKAKELYMCSRNEKKVKRKELSSMIDNAKQIIKRFTKHYGSLEPLWQKIKYKSDVRSPISKLMEVCEEDDFKLFQKIDAMYNPDL